MHANTNPKKQRPYIDGPEPSFPERFRATILGWAIANSPEASVERLKADPTNQAMLTTCLRKMHTLGHRESLMMCYACSADLFSMMVPDLAEEIADALKLDRLFAGGPFKPDALDDTPVASLPPSPPARPTPATGLFGTGEKRGAA